MCIPAVAFAERLGEFNFHSVCFGANGQHFKHGFAVVFHALKSVPKFALLAPVARVADHAHVECAVGTPGKAVRGAFKPLRKTEHTALVIAVYFFHKYALQPAVAHITVQQLVFVGPVV